MAFADGTTFRGRWQSGAWLQSAADPARCRLRGRGLAHAVAGADAEFVIQVGLFFYIAICNSIERVGCAFAL